MNEATAKLFELAAARQIPKCNDNPDKAAFVYREIKKLVDTGADINARNEDGFNILQIILDVESPELPLNSTIENDGGYIDGRAWYVDGCLKNGFQYTPKDLTDMLRVYCVDGYVLEHADGDIQLICTLLEKGADWNCRSTDDPDVSILMVISSFIIEYSGTDAIDWRYKMLCAYYNAGGDLYVKNEEGKYVWECCHLHLTAIAFFLEHGVAVDCFSDITEDIEFILEFYKEDDSANILPLDIYNQWHFKEYVKDISRYKEVFRVLLEKTEKYPDFWEMLAKILPGAEYYDDEELSKINKDFYKPAEIYLQIVKEKFGDLKKVIDIVIESCRKNKFGDLGEFFSFVLPLYPEITEYFPWEKLSRQDWSWLLEKKPEFADRCNLWGNLSDADDIVYLFEYHPEIMTYVPLEKCNGYAWYSILMAHPHFADKCNKWDEISEEDWVELLEVHPALEKYKK